MSKTLSPFLILVTVLISSFISSQNIGIGTQSPTDAFHIKSDVSMIHALRVQIGNSTKFRILENGGTTIGLNNTTGTPSNGLYVHGNTGLGISNPQDKLEVNGNLRVNGIIKPDGQAGQVGQILVNDGNGNMKWENQYQYQNFREFTYSSSPHIWTIPAGINKILVELWGAGGGGGPEGGGGGGGYVKAQIIVVPGKQYSITIGQGGTGSSSTQTGADGGDTSLSGEGIQQLIAQGGESATSFSTGEGGDAIIVPATLQAFRINGEDGNPTIREIKEYAPVDYINHWVYGNGGDGANSVKTAGKGCTVGRGVPPNTTPIYGSNTNKANLPGGGGGGCELGEDGGEGYAIIRW